MATQILFWQAGAVWFATPVLLRGFRTTFRLRLGGAHAGALATALCARTAWGA